jgi:osmotically-inducible protein OsmY
MNPHARASVGQETESAVATVTKYIAQVARDSSDALEGDGANETEAGTGGGNCFDIEMERLAQSAIARRAFLAASKVRPVVRNGWLILVGEVEGPVQKRMAEDAVRDLDGIRGVSNNILIEADALAQRVGQKIDDAFVRSALFSAHRISITASDHKIILSGCVRSMVEREEAETAAWAVPGVAQVVNRLRVMV